MLLRSQKAMNWLISAFLSFLKLSFTTSQITMMLQSNGGEVGKDHEDDSDSKELSPLALI